MTGLLISIAVLLTTIEWMVLSWRLSDSDPWRRNRQNEVVYWLVLILRLVAACVAIGWPGAGGGAAFLVMLLATWFIAVRFHGTFNGGSDSMTLHILAAAAVAGFFPEALNGAVLYVALQSALSYFVAGLVKARSQEWRRGLALMRFLRHSNAVAGWGDVSVLTQAPGLAKAVSLSVIIFECAFPLALFVPALTPYFLLAGTLFHLGNWYFFGLNRFVFAWLATYPSIYAVSRSGLLTT